MKVNSVHRTLESDAITYGFQLPASDYVLVVESLNRDKQDIKLGLTGLYFEFRDQRWGAYDAIKRIEKSKRGLKMTLADQAELPDDVQSPFILDCASAKGNVDHVLNELIATAHRADLVAINISGDV